jgi:hypothetical protein
MNFVTTRIGNTTPGHGTTKNWPFKPEGQPASVQVRVRDPGEHPGRTDETDVGTFNP